jgi:hypothetical protein
MQYILYKIYFWKVFNMYYNLICILYALLFARNFILVKSGCYNLPPIQILSTVVRDSEHPTSSDIPEVEVLHPANNTSATTLRSSHTCGGTSSTKTNGGYPHQSSPWAPLPFESIQDSNELEQVRIEDWEDEAFDNEVVEEEELAKV